MKRMCGLTISLVIVGLFCASVGAASSKEPYKIGYIISQTGPGAFIGQRDLNATLAWGEEKINKLGGINGHPLKFITIDDQSDPNKAVMAAKKLATVEKVHALLGTCISSIGKAVAVVAEENNIPFVANTASEVFDHPVKYWAFRPGPVSTEYNNLMYKFLAGHKVRKLAVLNHTIDLGVVGWEKIKETASSKGFEIVAHETYDPADTDMTAQLTKIKNSGADGMILYGFEMAAGLAIKQARMMGMTLPIAMPPGVAPGILKANGKYFAQEPAVGIVMTIADVLPQTPDSNPFKAIMTEQYNLITEKHPGTMFSVFEAYSIHCLMLLADAMKRANPEPSNLKATRVAIRNALENTKNFKGSLGYVNMSPNDHRGNASEEILCVVNWKEEGGFKLWQQLK